MITALFVSYLLFPDILFASNFDTKLFDTTAPPPIAKYFTPDFLSWEDVFPLVNIIGALSLAATEATDIASASPLFPFTINASLYPPKRAATFSEVSILFLPSILIISLSDNWFSTFLVIAAFPPIIYTLSTFCSLVIVSLGI